MKTKKCVKKLPTIKSLQKQAVNFQHYGKTEALKQIEEKIEKV